MKKHNNNRFFKISIIISIAIHVIAIASINRLQIRSYLATKNILFANKTETQASSRKSPKEIINIVMQQKQTKNKTAITTSSKTSFPLQEKNGTLKNHFGLKDEALKTAFNFNIPDINQNYVLIDQSKKMPSLENEKIDISLPPAQITNYTKDLAQTSILTPEVEKSKQPIITSNNQMLLDKYLNSFAFSNLSEHDISENVINKFSHQKIKLFSKPFSLIDIPELSDLTTLSYKDFFDVEVTFAPQKDTSGFIFAITLIPKYSIKLNRLKQNIFFLVDRSNSIQKDRLTSTRHAITSSLSSLDKDDSFNILAFDTKLDVLANRNLSINDHFSISKAKGFLRNQNIGSFFSSTNFSIPLFKILNNNTKEDEINIAILLSNGDGLHKFKNYKIFNEWTKLNSGISLYSIGLNNDKNLSILDLFSFLNKGKMIASPTNRGIKRKLQKLLKSISYPIAKDITSNAICLDKSIDIKLYPLSDQSPNLYLNEPYVILGTINKIEDFTVFVQGKCKDHFFNFKKHINFDEAKQGGKILQKELAVKKASLCYEKFIADNNRYHLKEANSHLEPFEIEPTFR